jgi:hypothetical protein
MVTCLALIWVTVNVVPVVVALAAVETVKVVALFIAVIVTVSGFMIVAVNVSVAVPVPVAAVANLKLVALLTDVRTVSPVGILVPEMAVPACNEMVAGETIVAMALPPVMLAVKVIAVVVVLGIPLPLMVIPCVKAPVEAAVTVVLPLVVFAVIVADTPRLTQGLFELWQATQNVGLVETLYWLVPRLGVAATPSTVTLRVSPSWLKSMIVE